MIYARHEGVVQRARPGWRGFCPLCRGPVLAKCGTIVIWHWAHVADRCADSWAEESEWHLHWKAWALEQGWRVEVPIEKGGVRHRADIITPAGWVIELQHSGLDARQITERERFYGAVIWIWDMTTREERFVFNDRPRWTGFRWKRPMWSLCTIRRPLYLDFGHSLLRTSLDRVESRYGDYDVCLGRGTWGNRADLVSALGLPRRGVA